MTTSPDPDGKKDQNNENPSSLVRALRWLGRTLRHGLGKVGSAFGIPIYELKEIEDLESYILTRARSLSLPAGVSETLETWVPANFTHPLRSLLVRASFNARGYIFLNLVVIVGGFATSGISVASGSVAKHSSLSWLVFSVGLSVALAGGIAQISQPGSRSAKRLDLAIELREEGWEFVYSGKNYSKGDKTDFENFRDRISGIREEVVQIAKPESELAQVRRRSVKRRPLS